MAQIDDLLEQAEAQDGSSSWVLITKYQRKEFYVDSDRAVNVVGRKIEAIREEVSVQGENHSQYIEFIMDRYYDGIDIAEQTLAIHYEVGDVSDEDAPINVYKNDTQIKFGWVVESNLTQYATIIEFCIWARGTLADGNTYVLKTLPQKYEIQRGLTLAGGIVEPSTNWYLQFALTMDEKVAQAATSADKAMQAASSVDGVVETVTSAKDEVIQKASTVDTQHSEVESWHQESEQFRNEAEQFRNQAEAITGIGLAEEGKPGIVQPDGVTTKVDADGKLTVIGGGGASEEAIRALEEFTQQLDQDISTLDTELEQTNQQLQSTTDKVEDVQESIEAGFKKQAQGEEVHVTDAVDGKVVEFAMFGKAKQNTTQGNQLFNYDAWKNIAIKSGTAVFENNGITITANADDCYTEYRTDTPVPYPQEACIPVNEGDVLTLSWEEDTNKQGRIYIFPNDGSNGIVNTNNNKNKKLSYTVPSGVSFVTFRFGVQYAGDTISYKNIMINKGLEPLPYEPYTNGASPNPQYPQPIEVSGASGSVEVKSCGKNLFDKNATVKWGNTFDENGNEIKGTSTAWGVRQQYIRVNPLLNYTISGNVIPTNWNLTVVYYDINKRPIMVEKYQKYTGKIVLNIPENVYYIRTNQSSSGDASDVQMEHGTVVTEYEPYKETTSTIPTPNGLSGIKVSSGGNYTDENGQQWITDEIIRYADGSGEYIQRIEKAKIKNLSWAYDGSKMYSATLDGIKANGLLNLLCTNMIVSIDGDYIRIRGDNSYGYLYVYNSPHTSAVDFVNAYGEEEILYQLATPIHTPLTAEQIAEIAKLCMFYPVTNVSNDAECGMEVTYATLQEALMLQEAYNQSRESAQEIVDIKKELSDTTFKVETIIEKADLGIKETATGEEIHLTDSAEGKAVEFALYGKAEQNTTSGKNKLVFPYYHNSQTIRDVSFVVNNDGSVVANGTASGTVNFIFKPRDNNYSFEKGSYILSGCPKGGSATTYNITINKTANEIGEVIGQDIGNGFNFEVLEEEAPHSIYISIANGVKVENLVFKPMIRLASITDDTYEPFTNGATPRPDYPQPIEVSGESYNLLENTATSQTINGVTFTVNEDKSVTLNGTASASIGNYYINQESMNLDNMIATCEGINSLSGIYFAINNGTTTFNVFGSKKEVATSGTMNYARIYVDSGAVFNNVTIYPMIRKASVKNDRYIPYGFDRVKVKSVGEQLFDGVLELGRLANDTGNVMETTSAIRSANYIEVTGGDTITISNDKGYANYVYEYNTYKEYLGYTPSDSTHTLALKPNTKYIKFRTKESGSQNDLSTKFMINSGLEALPWEPYKETLSTIPTENGLASVNDSHDEIVKYADGSGKKVKRFKYLKVTSIQSGHKNNKGDTVIGYVAFDAKPTSNAIVGNVLCNRCVNVSANEQFEKSLNGIAISSGGRVDLSIVGCTTSAELRTYISENDVYILYELATPIETPLTAEEIAEIEKLHTFYPVTNISNDFDCGMRIEYVGEGIMTTNTKIPVIAQDGELESGDNIVVLFGKIKRMLENLNSRLSTLEQNSKTIVYSDTEPETVEENTIVMVYETEE